jgi:hypothetical protein
MPEASAALQGMFVALGLALGVTFVCGVAIAWRRTGASAASTRRATLRASAGALVWLAGTFALASSGRLSFETVPPTMVPLIAGTLGLAFLLGATVVGRRLAEGLPLAVLVGVQSFRLPLELMMHRAYVEGLMPVQMSYSGYNYDIVTGITAFVVALVVATGRAGSFGRAAAATWNVLGVLLLVNVIVIAFVSTPLPIRLFMNEPANVWITQPPFVWLPTVMVLAAILGHVVVFRKLRLLKTAAAAAIPAYRRTSALV